MVEAPSNTRLQAAIAAAQRRIAAGERPLYHVTSTTTPDGSADDVTNREPSRSGQ